MHTTRPADPRPVQQPHITRSLLPATDRRAARRSLTAVRRADRRVNKIATLAATRDARTCSCPGDPLAAIELDCPRCDADPWRDYPRSEHLGVIWERRACDKVAPLI